MTGPTTVTRVTGAVGVISAELRRRLTDPRRGWTSHDLGRDDVLVMTTGRTYAWQGSGGRGLFWSPQGDVSSVGSVDDAVHRANAPGIGASPEGVRLHASTWGYQPVHVASTGPGTLVFSDRIDDLLDLLDGPLDPDWDAWAAIFALRYTFDGLTPFEQVRVLRSCEERRWDPDRRRVTSHRGRPRAVDDDRPEASTAEVLDLLRDALVRHPALADSPDGATLPLSSGYDSRLLGAIAADELGADRLRALTTARHTEGLDPDVVHGAEVGTALGLTHTVLLPDGRAFPAYAEDGFDLVEHQTAEHVWYAPAVRLLHDWRRPVIDGLGGDVLVKNGIAAYALLARHPGDSASDVLWRRTSRLARSDLPGATPRMLAEVSARTRAHVDDIADRYPDTSTGRRASLMETRTHGVSMAPHRMIAHAVEPVTPFLHPDVTAALLSIPPVRREDLALSKELLEAVRPGLSAIMSTNDRVPGTTTGRRRANRPESRAWAEERLQRLGDVIGHDFTAEEIHRLHIPRADLWRLHLVMLSDWLERHGSRLTSTCPPWWSR